MIDVTQEKLISIRQVPRLLPCRPTGKRVHISAVYRWIQRGIRGVQLEAIRVGGTTYTSHEALQRFAAQLRRPGIPQSVEGRQTPRARERASAKAAKLVEKELGIRPAGSDPHGP